MNENLKMFCVYHKEYYPRDDNKGFIFYGVNEIYQKNKYDNNLLEYELDIYNPLLQKRGYMETSAYLHVYWNNLYKETKMVGFSQYDMKHKNKYDNLDCNKIYIMNTNKQIVKNGKWNKLMYENERNLSYLIESYNKNFGKNYATNELEGKPLSLWQTNIYPKETYEKLCKWLEKLVDEIYPWCNEEPYETHFGSIGGYTERAISIFNAYEIHEGKTYENLDIVHGIGTVNQEQYDKNSFLNKYDKNIYCKLVENKNIEEFLLVKTNNTPDSIIIENSKHFYIDDTGNKSEELMVITEDNELNIMESGGKDFMMYYKKVGEKCYEIMRKEKIFSRGLLDKMIFMNFINNKKNDGIMIEIGGHTGDDGSSNTYFFEKYLNYKTILIEPSNISYKELIRNRPNSICINKAVTDTKQMVKLYGCNETATTIESTNKRNVTIVEGIPLKEMLGEYKLKYVDLFVIDTEGSELTVLETFDWNIEVGVILIEVLSRHKSGNHVKHKEKDEMVMKFLREKGFKYEFSDNERTNQIWINEKYSRNLFEGLAKRDDEVLKENHYLNREYSFCIDNNSITHFITRNKILLGKHNPIFLTELKKRWKNHEPKTNSKIIKLLDEIKFEEKGYILDAGSHVGDTLLMIAIYLKEQGKKNIKVIGVEPDEEKCIFINELIKLNDLNNIIMNCNALSDIEGKYTINKSNMNSGSWTVNASDKGQQNFKTIDEICCGKNMYLIHLDVEGYELKALKGGNKTIKSTLHLIMEYEHIGMNELLKTIPSNTFKEEILDSGDVYLKNEKKIDYAKYTMVNIKHISEIQGFVDYINENNIEGAIVECGVWKGGIIMACMEQQKIYNTEREFYLYDTYEGMTEPDSVNDLLQDKIKYKATTNWHKVDLDYVKNNIEKCEYNKNKVQYVKGDVLKTLESQVPEKISILRLDTDWYTSTKKELEVLYKRVSNGGFVIIDDYRNKDKDGNPRGARVACDEFFPGIKSQMKIIKPISTENNYPYSFQKIINEEKITIYSYSNNQSVYNLSFPLFQQYCEMHNYEFKGYHENLEDKYKPHWNKIHYGIELMKSSKSEYIIWIDHDIIIKNEKIKIGDLIKKYKFEEGKELFMMSQDPVSNYLFNTGVIVFKNKAETLEIFEKFLYMRNNPKKFENLIKYGGFNFNKGLQDTRVMLSYFDQHNQKLLSVPHKILQSFYGQAEYYTAGDFCGHVAGPQGDELIEKLIQLKNHHNFDIVIPVGPKDEHIIEEQIKHTKRNIIGYRNIYLISSKNIKIDGCITIDENDFPFNIETVANLHGKKERNGWYLQQLLKLYVGRVVSGLLDRYLVIDSDTFFQKPITFVENNKCLYDVGNVHYKLYFEHMAKLHEEFIKCNKTMSGICHHMIFEQQYIEEILEKVEEKHKDKFYNVFLKCVKERKGSGASEYELYFNYVLKNYSEKIKIRKLKTNSDPDYISYHWYLR